MRVLPDHARYDLMLSPQFYVHKREELAVKYAFQAKRLAPSILDDLTGPHPMRYEAFKDEEGAWHFVAYDAKALEAFLESRGGSLGRVGKLYFAEQVRRRFDPPVLLGNNDVLGVVDDIATVIPRKLLADPDRLQTFDDSFRPDEGFGVKRSRRHHSAMGGSTLDGRFATTLAVVMLLIGLAYAAEGYRYQRAIHTAEDSLERLFEEHPKMRGSYARSSIHKKYLQTDTHQRAIRSRLQAVGRLTRNGAVLDLFSIDANGYKATLRVNGSNDALAALKKLAQSNHLEKIKLSGHTFETSGALP